MRKPASTKSARTRVDVRMSGAEDADEEALAVKGVVMDVKDDEDLSDVMTRHMGVSSTPSVV